MKAHKKSLFRLSWLALTLVVSGPLQAQDSPEQHLANFGEYRRTFGL